MNFVEKKLKFYEFGEKFCQKPSLFINSLCIFSRSAFSKPTPPVGASLRVATVAKAGLDSCRSRRGSITTSATSSPRCGSNREEDEEDEEEEEGS